MKRFFALTATILGLTCAACNRDAPPANKGGITITAPGVNVQTDPNGGVGVRAPGVKVDVNTSK
jgi:hypothetical protein